MICSTCKSLRDSLLRFVTMLLLVSFKDARGVEISYGDVQCNEYGSFMIELDIPSTVNLGDATLLVGWLAFTVTEWRERSVWL